MSLIRKATPAFALAALVFATGSASAQVYIGAALGQSSTSFNSSDFNLGVPGVSQSEDKTDSAFKLNVGYNFNRTWAVEGGYADLGKPQVNYTGTGALAGASGQAEVKQKAWFLAGKGTLPINERFNVFGKLGITWNRAELTASSNSAAFNAAAGLPASRSKNKTDALVGIGAGYALTKQAEVRVEYEDFGKFGDSGSTGRTRAKLWSVGLNYAF